MVHFVVAMRMEEAGTIKEVALVGELRTTRQFHLQVALDEKLVVRT
jgi:hypothetical protein